MDWKVVKAVMADGTKIINLWSLFIDNEKVANLFTVNERLYAGTVQGLPKNSSGLLDTTKFGLTIEQLWAAIRKVEEDDRLNPTDRRQKKRGDSGMGCRLPRITARAISKSTRSRKSV